MRQAIIFIIMLIYLAPIFYQVIKLSFDQRKRHRIMTEKLGMLEQELVKQTELLQEIAEKSGISNTSKENR